MTELQLGKLPSGWICPHCKAPLPSAMSMIGNRQPIVRKNLVLICSSCATINVLGDTELKPMTPEEFNRLDERSKSSIAVIRKQLQGRIKDGNNWNPKADGGKI